MKPIRFCALIAVMVSPLAGRVGETEEQLTKRFGAPTARANHTVFAQGKSYALGPKLSFRQDDWWIACDLIDGRCVQITYSKRGQWTEEHFQTVLNANSQGGKWTDIGKPAVKNFAREWRRNDGAMARWGSAGGLTVTVPAYDRAKAVAEAKARAEVARPAKI